MAHSITLQNIADTDIIDNDILGQICFAAPNESSGTDSIMLQSWYSLRGPASLPLPEQVMET